LLDIRFGAHEVLFAQEGIEALGLSQPYTAADFCDLYEYVTERADAWAERAPAGWTMARARDEYANFWLAWDESQAAASKVAHDWMREGLDVRQAAALVGLPAAKMVRICTNVPWALDAFKQWDQGIPDKQIAAALDVPLQRLRGVRLDLGIWAFTGSLTQAQRCQVLELSKLGWTDKAIGARYGLNSRTIADVLNKTTTPADRERYRALLPTCKGTTVKRQSCPHRAINQTEFCAWHGGAVPLTSEVAA
jgi:hypothetical protein